MTIVTLVSFYPNTDLSEVRLKETNDANAESITTTKTRGFPFSSYDGFGFDEIRISAPNRADYTLSEAR